MSGLFATTTDSSTANVSSPVKELEHATSSRVGDYGNAFNRTSEPALSRIDHHAPVMQSLDEEEEGRPPYLHVCTCATWELQPHELHPSFDIWFAHIYGNCMLINLLAILISLCLLAASEVQAVMY